MNNDETHTLAQADIKHARTVAASERDFRETVMALARAGMPVSHIASLVSSVRPHVIREWCKPISKKKGRPPGSTNKEPNQAHLDWLARYDAGESLSEIARDVGVSRQAVSQAVQNLT